MGRKWLGAFVAVDSGIVQYTIDIWCTFVDGQDPPDTPTLGSLEFRTSDDRPVRRIAKGVYEISGPRPIILTSDDPGTL